MLVTMALFAGVLFCGVDSDEAQADRELEVLPIERNVVDLTNAERARYGLAALEIDSELMESARQHTTWMTLNRRLVHSNSRVAENIATGQPSSQDVLRAWMSSAGHRANILNRSYRRIGVAAYRTEDGRIYWCQQFLR